MMPIFRWEIRLQRWVARLSEPLLSPLSLLNFLLADEAVIFLALPLLFLHSRSLSIVMALGLLITSTKVEDHLKQWFARGRPRDPMEWGLPSGDCALVSIWAPALLGWWAVLPILIVAWSRIARDAHYPLDTVAGVLLGLWFISPVFLF